jgi:hypothetical protein
MRGAGGRKGGGVQLINTNTPPPTPLQLVSDARVAPGLTPGGLTGDLGWNPLSIKVTDRRRLSELQNGRAAMVAISAWIAASEIQGSVPIPLPW